MQVVDGVLTQDGDAFLYGATVVYKDLTTAEKVLTLNYYAINKGLISVLLRENKFLRVSF